VKLKVVIEGVWTEGKAEGNYLRLILGLYLEEDIKGKDVCK
jgi:hypothetical protein